MKGGGRSARRSPPRSSRTIGAGNGTRTRDIKLGKLALYQLSYARSMDRAQGNLAEGAPPGQVVLSGSPRWAILEGMQGSGSGRCRDLVERKDSLYFFPDQKITEA